MNFRGTLTFCSADNPAACLIGHCIQLSGSAVAAWQLTLICRQRYVVTNNYTSTGIKNSQFTESELQLRTPATHTSHKLDLEGPPHNHIAGVSEKSILNKSRYFHVVNGLVPDVMHDVLEGITQLTMKCLLQYLIQEKKYFTLTILNERMMSFNYGIDVSNKPSEISKATFNSTDSYTLKQSGTYVHDFCLDADLHSHSLQPHKLGVLQGFFHLLLGI